ncbi:MAG: hypothetical protein ACXWCY_16730 [Burkholderiales bacterium]
MESPAAFIVTPNPTDAEAAVSFLREAGLSASHCSTLADLCFLPIGAIGCAVLVEEALVHPDIDNFLEVLAAQPAWSDLPLVLIASEGAALGALLERVFPQSGNLAVLQRPLNPVSLVSAVQVGLRARHRQFQVRICSISARTRCACAMNSWPCSRTSCAIRSLRCATPFTS